MVTTLPLDPFHTAHLAAAAGHGFLVCPSAEADVWLAGESVHGAAWADVVSTLAALGWQPRRDEAGLLRFVGHSVNGEPVVEVEKLRGAGPVDPARWRTLCSAAGLVAEGRPGA